MGPTDKVINSLVRSHGALVEALHTTTDFILGLEPLPVKEFYEMVASIADMLEDGFPVAESYDDELAAAAKMLMGPLDPDEHLEDYPGLRFASTYRRAAADALSVLSSNKLLSEEAAEAAADVIPLLGLKARKQLVNVTDLREFYLANLPPHYDKVIWLEFLESDCSVAGHILAEAVFYVQDSWVSQLRHRDGPKPAWIVRIEEGMEGWAKRLK